MLSEGFDPRIKAVKEALHVSITGEPELGCHELLSVLLSVGFDVNYQRPADYWSPLHVACSLLRGNLVDALLSAGADPSSVAKVSVPYHIAFLHVESVSKAVSESALSLESAFCVE